MYESRTTCRSCGSSGLAQVLSLGEPPLTAAFLREEQLSQAEARFPLNVVFCTECSLMQILETVSPEMLFCRDYPYYSSFSEALLEHSRKNAVEVMRSRRLSHESMVVEVGSNDGYMLRNFVEAGIPVLGIDPAEGPAHVAEEKGVRTLRAFFGEGLARTLREKGLGADVLIANNVLAHVPDLNGFVEGIRILLKDDGLAVLEVPYVRDLIERCEFDTIYHEHHCYFAVTPLVRLFGRHELSLNRVEHVPIHGGSLRLYVGRREDVDGSVKNYLIDEAQRGLNQYEFYCDFATKVERIKEELVRLVQALKTERKKVAAYGAAAKGVILLTYADIGSSLIEFAVDRNVHKQGMYMPGVRIPVRPPEALLSEMPEYVLLLAWNFKDEILAQQSEYRKMGGMFIEPIPFPRVIE